MQLVFNDSVKTKEDIRVIQDLPVKKRLINPLVNGKRLH